MEQGAETVRIYLTQPDGMREPSRIKNMTDLTDSVKKHLKAIETLCKQRANRESMGLPIIDLNLKIEWHFQMLRFAERGQHV